MKIESEDIKIIKSFLERLEGQRDFLESLPNLIDKESYQEQFEWAKDNIIKLLTEVSMLEINDFIPIFSELYNIFNALISGSANVFLQDEKEQAILKKIIFDIVDYTLKNTLKAISEIEKNVEQKNMLIEIETDIINGLLEELKKYSKNFKEQSFFDLSEEKQEISKDTVQRFLSELSVLMSELNTAINVFILSPSRESFFEYLQVFDQIKGNVDLILASLDDFPEENHPLMVFYDLCNIFDNYNYKIYNLESIDKPEYIPFNEMYSVFNQLISELESKKQNNTSSVNLEPLKQITSDIIGSVSGNKKYEDLRNEFINVKPDEEALIKKTQVLEKSSEISTENNDLKEVDSEIINNTVTEKAEVKAPEKKKDTIIESIPQEDAFMKVRQDYLENLTNMIGELIVAKSTLMHIKTKIHLNDNKLSILQAIENTEKMFERVIGDIDNTVMTVRLQKVKDVFSRFPRLVRDIAKNSGKKIDFEIIGEDLELDNIILKQIGDPLMHIIRNSCDHGIESLQDRLSAGKSEAGKIVLKAEIKNQKMYISVLDDGKGLNPDLLIMKAIEKNLITEQDAEKMTNQQAYQLIFMPGFSTAQQITEISGRGVGMDVVMQNIQKVKGEVIIDSKLNKFTKITLALPLTISVSKGLLIGLYQDTYIVPLENIVSIEHIYTKEIHKFQEGYFINHKDSMLGLRHLGQILHNREADKIFNDKDKTICIILNINGDYKALAIDNIYGIQEFSIKNLPESIKDIEFYNGCTIMSDGKAVVVLNVPKLFNI